jgi:hypothetical protein
MLTKLILSIYIVCYLLFPAAPASGQPFTLVTPNTIPGWNTANEADVLRFTGKKSDDLVEIELIPWNLLNDPSHVAFDAVGELFVANRHGNVLEPIGTIARFKFDAKGNYIADGVISGNSLQAVHGLAFAPTGELFAANLGNYLISRFLFDAGGSVIANGTFNTGALYNQGLAFSATGELFSTTGDSGVVRRWKFDSTGAVTSNGSFTIPGATGLHGLTFSESGELFVGDIYQNQVYRYNFDDTGNPISNGQIPIPGGPHTPAFSPSGELFVTSHFSGLISRFVFDEFGNAISNGSTQTETTLGGLAIWSPQKGGGKPKSSGRGDSLPVTAETVVDAIDSLPETLLVPCNFVIIPPGGNLELGCPNGWLLNFPRSDLVVSSATPTSFSYSLNVNTSGSIPVSSSVAGSCTLTFGTPTGVPVTGTATFSSSSDGAPLNRLQLLVNTISSDSVQFSGCGALSSLLDVLEAYLSSSIETTVADILSEQFCGAKGQKLFGPCP